MNARFQVVDEFDLPIRRVWVLRGEVVEGSVRPGMFLSFPFNDSVTMSAEIRAVETVDGPGQASAIGAHKDPPLAVAAFILDGQGVIPCHSNGPGRARSGIAMIQNVGRRLGTFVDVMVGSRRTAGRRS